MTINLERAAMRGKLAGLQDGAKRLRLKIESSATAIRQGLNTALTPVDDLEVPQIAEQMDNLVMAWAELQKISSDIARLEKELR
ncbi:MAG: hypothetical protein PHO83_03830 [Geobacteraceae bacterium]|nr:hypothetical protein [Geobacteraceae bacterium]